MTVDLGAAPSFEVRVEQAGDQSIVFASGELDIATAEEFQTVACAALAEGDIEVDLQDLTFIDSSGVRALAELVRAANTSDRALTVRPQLQTNVQQVFDLTGMANLIPFRHQSSE